MGKKIEHANFQYEKKKKAIVLLQYKGGLDFADGNWVKCFSDPSSVITEIGPYCFRGKNIPRIVLPERLRIIGDGAFQDCGLLKDVDLPNSVEQIGASAFSGCTELTHVKIGKKLRWVGPFCFWGCKNLHKIIIDSREQEKALKCLPFTFNHEQVLVDNPSAINQVAVLSQLSEKKKSPPSAEPEEAIPTEPEHQEENSQKKMNRWLRLLILSISAMLILSLLAAGAYYIHYRKNIIEPELQRIAKYQKADYDMQEGNLQDAAYAFSELTGYKDSDSKYWDCQRALATKNWLDGNAEESFAFYKVLAEQNEPDAQLWMQEMYSQLVYLARENRLVPGTREYELWDILKRKDSGDWIILQSQNSVWAKDIAGLLYLYGLCGNKADPSTAFKHFKNAADSDDSYGMLHLANVYLRGDGVNQDSGLALQYYLKSAEKGNGWAKLNLGSIYLHGNGVERDEAKAWKYYGESAAVGNLEAQELLTQKPANIP